MNSTGALLCALIDIQMVILGGWYSFKANPHVSQTYLEQNMKTDGKIHSQTVWCKHKSVYRPASWFNFDLPYLP